MSIKNLVIIILSTVAGTCFGVALSTHLLISGNLGSTYRAYVVQSGSMEPAIKTGSIVVTKSAESYKNGDVITFAPNGDYTKLITHRIVTTSIEESNVNSPVFKTKGDANEEADSWSIKAGDIIGKEYLTIPYIGYLSNFVRTPKGFVVLVVIPASIIIYEELKNIGREVLKFKKRSSPKLTRKGILIPVFATLLLMITFTGAYFFDSEHSIQNILGAATSFDEPETTPLGSSLPTASPTPTPGASPARVVINELFESGDNGAEWVELYNAGGSSANLKNWTIADGNSADVVNASDFLLAPGAFVVLGANTNIATLWSIPADKFIDIGSFLGSGFNSSGDIALLSDDTVTEIDKVTFGEIATGHSIERSSPGLDTDTAADFIDQDTPSPGI